MNRATTTANLRAWYRGTPWAGPVLVAGAAAAGCVGVWFADPTTPGGIIPECPFRAATGWDCPGCGASRMTYSLLHGDVAAAVNFNAVGVVAVILLVITYINWTRDKISGRFATHWQNRRWAPIAIGVVIVGWALLRNIVGAPLTSGG